MKRIKSAITGRVIDSPFNFSHPQAAQSTFNFFNNQQQPVITTPQTQKNKAVQHEIAQFYRQGAGSDILSGKNMSTVFCPSAQNIQKQRQNDQDVILKQLSQFKFPLGLIQTKREVIQQLQNPITKNVDDILKNLIRFVKDFPVAMIPHITQSNQVNDILHIGEIKRPSLKYSDIKNAFEEIQKADMARLTGMVSHFCYWIIFGHINQFPIDKHYLNQLFVSVSHLASTLSGKYKGRRIFATFVMPMVLLAIRQEVENVFREEYPLFFKLNQQETTLLKCLNGVITYILDPNLYYSRFSFLQSDRHAIRLKTAMNRSNLIPKINSKFYTRSALIKQLIPVPSDGKVRATFREKNSNSSSASTAALSNITTRKTMRNYSTATNTFQERYLSGAKSFHDLKAGKVQQQINNNNNNINNLQNMQTKSYGMIRSKSGFNFKKRENMTTRPSIGENISMKSQVVTQNFMPQMQEGKRQNSKSDMLEILSRAQMYQIAIMKVNDSGFRHTQKKTDRNQNDFMSGQL